MFNKILVVCVGNICRSPIGERLLRQLLPEKEIASAGVSVAKSRLEGKAANSTAIEVAAKHGLDLQGHSSRQLTRTLCSEYDLILVMEKAHLSALTEIAAEARGKAMLFGQWIGEKDIPDPYQQSSEAFEHAFKLIDQAAQEWAKKL
ncbi:arsenate reductase/protein-tyrosine-phosphatase family protein [Vibrio mediterranei]|uniref:arsenate reductase/protein-tyrosine-phosphatase family protein n=1 Tax=Vibrio mediterranei TaxID=689 RepID=UPI0040678E65